MSGKRARYLSEVADASVPQGYNDGRWSLIEHQLYQARISLGTARQVCEQIGERPENSEDEEMARAALEVVTPVYIEMLKSIAAVRALMTGTDLVERIGRKEL